MVVVEEHGTPAGLRQVLRETRRERGRAAPGRGKLMCLQPPIPQLYIGEREGAAPPLGFPPQGVRQPQNPSRVAAKWGEREAHQAWAFRAHLP